MESEFSLSCSIIFDIYLNASQYDNALFSFTLFSCPKYCISFTSYFSTLRLYRHNPGTFFLIWLDIQSKCSSVDIGTMSYCNHGIIFFTFGPRGPRGQNVAAIALDMGQAHLWYENNTMQTIHAIQTLRTACGFLDMGDGCCLIFNKN